MLCFTLHIKLLLFCLSSQVIIGTNTTTTVNCVWPGLSSSLKWSSWSLIPRVVTDHRSKSLIIKWFCSVIFWLLVVQEGANHFIKECVCEALSTFILCHLGLALVMFLLYGDILDPVEYESWRWSASTVKLVPFSLVLKVSIISEHHLFFIGLHFNSINPILIIQRAVYYKWCFVTFYTFR